MCIISFASGNMYFKFIRCRSNRKLCTVAMFVAISIITRDTDDNRVSEKPGASTFWRRPPSEWW